MRWQNLFVVAVSYLFYGWWDPRFLILIAFTTICSFLSGVLIGEHRWPRLILWVNVSLNLCILGVFKYFDFFSLSLSRLLGVEDPLLLHLLIPVGISFYTFQILSYVIDVYYERYEAENNILTLGTYISMFPQLIAGPIVRYKDIELSLTSRTHSLNKISCGIRRFSIGLGKKVLIANTLGLLVEAYKVTEAPSVIYVWLYAIAASLQIYFDFSGYSDMAIGLGSLFGFNFPENFNYPYVSESVTEFWRRWHMTLGQWFRDYLYIPLGGNRVTKIRWIFNIFVVWMATGLWHGASWNFVIWGLYFAVLLMLEKLVLLEQLKKTKVIGHIYLILLVIISFVIFDGEDIHDSLSNIAMMFGFGNVPVWTMESVFMLINYGTVLLIAIIGAAGLPALGIKKLCENKSTSKYINILEPIFIGLLLIICTGFLVNGSFNPFLYFRF